MKEGDNVRLYDYPEDDINGYATIKKVFNNGDVWIANFNMPYAGTISKIVNREEFIRMTTEK